LALTAPPHLEVESYTVAPRRSGVRQQLRVDVVLLVVVPVGELPPQRLLLVAQFDSLAGGFLGFAWIVGIVVRIVSVVARFEVVEEPRLSAFFVGLLFGLTHRNPP
jgi:hypothetical protein